MIGLNDILKVISDDFELMGIENKYVSNAASIDNANKDSITFCVDNSNFDNILYSKAGIIICKKGINITNQIKDKVLIMVDNPRYEFINVLNNFFASNYKNKKGIHETAIVHPEAEIHPSVFIGAYACIGKCNIQENTVIDANVKINDSTIIGKNVVIHSGAQIGVDGFSYERDEKNRLVKFLQIGGVVIENNVEIGSGTCIAKGTLDKTIIKSGSVIGNVVTIGHNCNIGENVIILTQSVVCGGVTTENNVWIGPGSIISNKVIIREGAKVSIGSVVTKNVEKNNRVTGNFAIDHDSFIKNLKRKI